MTRAKQDACHPLVHRLGFSPMNTVEELGKLSEKACRLKEKGRLKPLSEEKAKWHLINPFIEALGYDLIDEVEPEYEIQVGANMMKCDYAIKKDDETILLIEAKKPSVQLGAPDQLSTYFGQKSEVWLGIFTNGAEYRFYSGDPDGVKKMDPQPFLVLDLLEFDEAIAEMVSTFAKDQFNPDDVRELAQKRIFQQKYETAIRDALREELEEPSEELFQLLINKVGAEGEELERLRPLVKEVANQILNLPPPPIDGNTPPKPPPRNESGIPIRLRDGGQIFQAFLTRGGMVQLANGSLYRPSGAAKTLGRRVSYNGWNEWKYNDQQAGRELPIDQLRERKDDDQIQRAGMTIGWISRPGPRQY